MAQRESVRRTAAIALLLGFALFGSPTSVLAQAARNMSLSTENPSTLEDPQQCLMNAQWVRDRDISTANARLAACLGILSAGVGGATVQCILGSVGTVAPGCLIGFGMAEVTVILGCGTDFLLTRGDISENFDWAVRMCGV
jgi:hypothetical protein